MSSDALFVVMRPSDGVIGIRVGEDILSVFCGLLRDGAISVYRRASRGKIFTHFMAFPGVTTPNSLKLNSNKMARSESGGLM